jgi:hypothetical protein
MVSSHKTFGEDISYHPHRHTIVLEGGHWMGEVRHFDNLDFIVIVTFHISPKGKHLVRRYGAGTRR